MKHYKRLYTEEDTNNNGVPDWLDEKITTVLRTAGESEFLNGHNEKVWKADFEWLMRPNNFIKVLEGKYHNRTKADVMP